MTDLDNVQYVLKSDEKVAVKLVKNIVIMHVCKNICLHVHVCLSVCMLMYVSMSVYENRAIVVSTEQSFLFIKAHLTDFCLLVESSMAASVSLPTG